MGNLTHHQTTHPAGSQPPPRAARYEGLDLFRVVSIYGIVIYHVYVLGGLNPSLSLLVRARDCAFPVIIMSSVFVLARSFERKPGRTFRQFFAVRFERIWVPFLIWTILYWTFFGVALPLLKGGAPRRPPATLLISGHWHLWFLQFIFVCSLVLSPLLFRYPRDRRSRRLISVGCFVAGLSYVLFLRPFLEQHVVPPMPRDGDLSLYIFTFQTVDYLFYVPLGLGLALLADELAALHSFAAFRALTVLAAVAALGVHLFGPQLPFTRGIYSLAVFVALLRPARAGAFRAGRFIAKYTYAIYILHLGVVIGVVAVLYALRLRLNGGVILAASLIAFGLSLLLAVLLRSLFPRDWFLPLVDVSGGKGALTAPARGEGATAALDLREQAGVSAPRRIL